MTLSKEFYKNHNFGEKLNSFGSHVTLHCNASLYRFIPPTFPTKEFLKFYGRYDNMRNIQFKSFTVSMSLGICAVI